MTTKTGRTTPDTDFEKQMGGCMAGFFNLFDRHHLRHHHKRLPPPPPPPSTPPVIDSPSKQQQLQPEAPAVQAAAAVEVTTAEVPTKSPWKFAREAPRLSLDSRAVADGKGGLRPREIRIRTGNVIDDDEGENQRRSPSVIARLMGLEPAPTGSESEPVKKVELRRSASESRSRDYRFVEPMNTTSSSFLSPAENAGEKKAIKKQPVIKNGIKTSNNQNNSMVRNSNQCSNHSNYNSNYNSYSNNQRRLMLEKRSYYDTADFYPPEIMMKKQQQLHQHHQHQPVTIYGEIERKLRMKGIDEQSKDLETLKNILEALQLKGLLHSSSAAASSPSTAAKSRQNVVYDRTPLNRRRNSHVSAVEPSVSPRRERPVRTGRSENRSSSPVLRRKGGGSLSVETQRKSNETTTRNANSPVRSPRPGKRSDLTVSRSPRGRRSTVEINRIDRVNSGSVFTEDEVSTVSESSFSTSSHTDNERWRVEEYKDGRNLLERCDKLLNSIAEITASPCSNSNSNSNSNSSELQQPSPVSVLDSSFYKEDDSSPSPVKKRTIHFKDPAALELEDEQQWSPLSSSIQQQLIPDNDLFSSDDFELNYISEVLRASNFFPDDDNLFFLLEKQISIRGGQKSLSKASILQRKLIFDTIIEILERNQHLPPWKPVTGPGKRPVSDQIRSELRIIQEQGSAPTDDLFEVVCGVLKKDMARDSITNGWVDSPVEVSETVLDIERLIFKDLIGESIRDLALLEEQSVGLQAPRRKLVF